MPVWSAAKSQCMLIFSATPRDRVVARARMIAEARIVIVGCLDVGDGLESIGILEYGKDWFN